MFSQPAATSPRPHAVTRARRRTCAAALAGILALSLAACSGSDDKPTPPPAPTSAGPVAPTMGTMAPPLHTPTPAPSNVEISIPHRFGTTTYIGPAQRVVSVGRTDQDALIAFGTVPVATTEWFGKQPGAIFPWARIGVRGKPLPVVLDASRGFPFDRIKALKPDLIVGIDSDMTAADYAKLSAIAPTVGPPTTPGPATWQSVTSMVGTAMLKENQARDRIAFAEGSIANAKREYVGENPLPVALVWVPPGAKNLSQVTLLGAADPRARLFAEINLKTSGTLARLGGGAPVPLTRAGGVPALEGAVVVWFADQFRTVAPLLNDPAYAKLAVRRKGRDIVITRDKDGAYYDAMLFQSSLSVLALSAPLTDQLEAISDNDPNRSVPGVGALISKPKTLPIR